VLGSHALAGGPVAPATGSDALSEVGPSTPAAAWEMMLATPALLLALALGAVVGLTLLGLLGDYPSDAGPAVAALASGSFRHAAAVPFMMGPFSIVLRAPFAALAQHLGAGQLGVYRAGVAPCLVVAAGLGIVLARRPSGDGRKASWLLLVSVLAVLSPPALAAVRNGHPEEALGGALCVAAVLVAERRRTVACGLALGLALATKQWALVAVVPVLLASVPYARAKVAVVAGLTAAVLYVPFVVQDRAAFMTATRAEAHVVSAATPQTVWLVASHERQVRVDGSPVLTYDAVSRWVPPVSHALIVAIGVLAGLGLWRRQLSPAQPLALLAFVFLVRCILDPVDQDYFHLPFFLALLAWEVRADRLVRDLPLATLSTFLCLWLTFDLLHRSASPWLVNVLYLTWTFAIGAHLVVSQRGGWLRARFETKPRVAVAS
jgi:hypothetical protein